MQRKWEKARIYLHSTIRADLSLEGIHVQLSPDQWQARSSHLDEALDMTEEERSTWLSAMQTENPALAQQLEILLDEHRLLSAVRFSGQALD